MREAEVAHVGNQSVGQFLPRERPPVGVTSPGRRVHLVDRERRIVPPAGARALPRRVGPCQRRGVGDDRSGGRRRLGRARERICALREPAIGAENLVLV